MDPHSSAYQTAKKQWRNRNSSGQFCMDEYGELVECQAPPSWEITEIDLPHGAHVMSEQARTTHFPEGDQTSDYEAHAQLHTHIYDPTLSDPDA